MGEPFTHHLRVRYAECDPQGVVFNSHYLAYFDTSLTELWRAAFGGYQSMIERGLDVMVLGAQLSFRSPAHFDELLALQIAVTRLGNTSIASSHRIIRDGELLVEGTMMHVVVDLAALKKTPIPNWMREQLVPWTVESS